MDHILAMEHCVDWTLTVIASLMFNLTAWINTVNRLTLIYIYNNHVTKL